MRKPNLIIGKKQIILAGLTLVLGIAVYMNYVFSEVGEEIAADADISSAENAFTSLKPFPPHSGTTKQANALTTAAQISTALTHRNIPQSILRMT